MNDLKAIQHVKKLKKYCTSQPDCSKCTFVSKEERTCIIQCSSPDIYDIKEFKENMRGKK